MHDRSATGTTMENPGFDFHSHFEDWHHFGGDPRLDRHGHPAPYDWMRGGGRGGRRAMMMAMMDPSGSAYGMEHGHFGFGGRGGRGGRGGWFGFGGRGRGHGHCGRGRGRHGRTYVVDDDEPVTSMADQMDECHLNEGCRHGAGSSSSESSSSSSSSESDDEQNAPGDDVQENHPHDGEVEEQSKDPAQRETVKSNATELEKDHPSSSHTCNHGYYRRRHGPGHHKHHHGKHQYHHYPAFQHSMIPPPPLPPHLHGFIRPPFPPMYHPHHHGFPDFHGNRHMARKFFKRSMKQWYQAQTRAWKRQQLSHCCHHRVQRSDEDETTAGCENDDDFVQPENQLPPPWLFFPYDHHGRRHGRRGKKEKKHGKRLRKCNCERPRPAEDITAKTTAKDQVDVADQVEKVQEVHDESNVQSPMEANAE